MEDKYYNFDELVADPEKKENEHYRISARDVHARICVISPHGGGIEPGISELVRAVAAEEFSFYLFEGIQSKNLELHITSVNFNEPKGEALVARHRTALALHGYDGGEGNVTFLGGRFEAGRECVARHLRQSGFKVPPSTETPADVQGLEPDNICNRGAGNLGGIQLEITIEQRGVFFLGDIQKRRNRVNTTDAFEKYVSALRSALHEIDAGF